MSLCERHYGDGMLKLDAPHALSIPGWFQESIVKLVLEPKTRRGVGTSQKIQKQEFCIELQVVCDYANNLLNFFEGLCQQQFWQGSPESNLQAEVVSVGLRSAKPNKVIQGH